MLPDIPKLLHAASESVRPFTAAGLAAFFGLPEQHFHRTGPGKPFQFFQGGLTDAVAYGLRGTIFLADGTRIVRGAPRILPASDYCTDPIAVEVERAFFAALAGGREASIEIKEPGIGIRAYVHGGALHLATDSSPIGANPLLGTGIDNVRALGIDCAGQARRLIEANFKGAAALARLGYVPIFEMMLPERESIIAVERPDMILTDVIDPDYCFVDGLEKERIAEDYGLNPVRLHGKMNQAATQSEFYSRLRGLEHIAAKDDLAGFVVKVPRAGDQLSIQIVPPGVRQAWTTVAAGDLRAAFDAALADFTGASLGPEAVADFAKSKFFEDVLLEYLGDRGRSTRWQAAEFLSPAVAAEPKSEGREGDLSAL